jgi:hypothetical protein
VSRALVVIGSTLGLTLGTLALLLAAFSIYLDRWDGVAFYAALTAACFAAVTWLLRRDRRARRERGELPARRAPREPIRVPLVGAVLVYAVWWMLAALVMAWVDDGVYFFDYAVVAPFAAFLLTILSFAGRHIAFRLTAEDTDGRGR